MSTVNRPNVYQNSFQVVENFAEYLLSDQKFQNESKILNELSEYALNFIKVEKFIEAAGDIFNNLSSEINDASEEFDHKTVLKKYDEEINKINSQSNNSTKCKKYENFLKLINNSTAKTDEEVVAVTEYNKNLDPITKLPIVEAVKNKVCGHIYEKSSIIQLIQRNSKTKCPIAGCVGAKHVKLSDLISE